MCTLHEVSLFEVIIMRALSYVMLGIIGTLAFQKISQHQTQLSREMRKMMKNNSRAFRKIREIF